MTIATRPEVPLQVITPDLVRASVKRAKKSLVKAAEEIVWQVEREAWRTLGYSSWDAMREGEYGGVAVMVPRKNRPELVARFRGAGLTQKQTADTLGVSEKTVKREDEPTYAPREAKGTNDPFASSDPDVIDAEVIEDDEPIHVNTQTGEVTDSPSTTADPAVTESAASTTCPTCHGTGKVTR